MVNSPLNKALFLGGNVALGGKALDSHHSRNHGTEVCLREILCLRLSKKICRNFLPWRMGSHDLGYVVHNHGW